MNKIYSHLEQIDIIGKLADLKDLHYQNTLAISSVIELLIDKGLLTAEEIRAKAAQLDEASIPRPSNPTL
jgi:hypothetical protein